jgi:RNA polymerase sigma-70 factor, ECF subfamily
MDEGQFSQLMGRVKAGDTAAMGSLLIASFQPLRWLIAQQMGDLLNKASAEPEDVIQEVYAAAWSHLPTAEFESFDALLGWLRQIAENKLIDLHRAVLADKRDVRRQTPAWEVQSGTYVNLLDRVSSPMTTPSVGAARNEAAAVLMVRMLQLPEDYRKVIQWRLVEGLAVAEVAQRLDRSEAAIHMLLHRALKQLRELMGAPSDYFTQT